MTDEDVDPDHVTDPFDVDEILHHIHVSDPYDPNAPDDA